MVAVYSRWWAWYGGVFYGPRFFLIASIPASLVIAVRLRPGERSPTAILVSVSALALSLWVGVTSAIGSATPPICTQDDFALEHLCWYTPEFSALWRPLSTSPRSRRAPSCTPASRSVSCSASLPVLVAAEPLVLAQLRQLARTLRDGSW